MQILASISADNLRTAALRTCLYGSAENGSAESGKVKDSRKLFTSMKRLSNAAFHGSIWLHATSLYTTNWVSPLSFLITKATSSCVLLTA